TSCGLETDPDGNVCYSSYWEVFKLNATTGEGMMHVLPEDSSTLTKVAFTDAGEMIVSFVLPGNGINIYDADWALISKAIPGESTNAYARTVEVAPDGSALYYCEFTGGNGLVRFNSDSDIYGDFTSSSDTLTPGFAVESANWDPTGTYLWAGHTAGSGAWSAAAHYAFDPANNFAIVDSMVLPASEVDLGIKPRGIDFAPDGNTAYVTFFNSWDSDPIYKFEKDAVGVWQHTGSFIAGYSLKAAYPNPFNPSTKLDITMKEAGVADLRVYDLRGAEVAVLSNSYMPAGDHTFTFDGSNLSAGVYIAKLTVNGAMYTQSMTLVK
ncbi:MAG: T9SS type A sorting domain-containing protein, partial [Candidatus Marinimicrobia bacterium]|nr:T9SS type A sorting domain-containing protein [Candidatus Neomarinimicrobiota bacterium]